MFNLTFISLLWTIIIVGCKFIYYTPSRENIIFWSSLLVIWIYLYRPVVNRFFYTKMMNELAFKLGKLDSALAKIDLVKKPVGNKPAKSS
jgi:hypothetical protein